MTNPSRRTRRWLAAIASLALAACSPGKTPGAGRFSTALGARLHSGGTIDLAQVDGPIWDELFVFAPGSTRDENCQRIHLGWLECKTTMPKVVPANEDFLVFMVNGRISSAQRHSLFNGAFGSEVMEDGRRIERSAARFVVTQESAGTDAASPLPRLRKAR